MQTLDRPKTNLDRVYDAVEKVKERLRRAVGALEDAKIPYAVIGGNAVADWIIRVDPGAERFTKDVDILVRPADLDRIIVALESVGFKYSYTWEVHAFSDGDSARISDGVHLVFENQKVKPDSFTAAPFVDESEPGSDFQVISLEALVRMKLESHRLRDRTHLADFMNVGLIDESWPAKYPSPLKERLEAILNDPNERQPI